MVVQEQAGTHKIWGPELVKRRSRNMRHTAGLTSRPLLQIPLVDSYFPRAAVAILQSRTAFLNPEFLHVSWLILTTLVVLCPRFLFQISRA